MNSQLGIENTIQLYIENTINYVFIENDPYVSGPTQFKPVLSKGQLY